MGIRVDRRRTGRKPRRYFGQQQLWPGALTFEFLKPLGLGDLQVPVLSALRIIGNACQADAIVRLGRPPSRTDQYIRYAELRDDLFRGITLLAGPSLHDPPPQNSSAGAADRGG
jgi:hypothetical protein